MADENKSAQAELYETIKVETSGRVGMVHLHRPNVLNATLGSARWKGRPSQRSTTSCDRWSSQMAAEARPGLYRPAYLRANQTRNSSRGCGAEQNVLRRTVPGRHGLRAS